MMDCLGQNPETRKIVDKPISDQRPNAPHLVTKGDGRSESN